MHACRAARPAAAAGEHRKRFRVHLHPPVRPTYDSEGEGGDEEGLFGEGGFLGSDYDSDDNSTAAQVHRFFAKVEGLGIDLGEDMFSDPWA